MKERDHKVMICSSNDEFIEDCLLIQFRRIPTLLVMLSSLLLLSCGCAKKSALDFAGESRTVYEPAVSTPANLSEDVAMIKADKPVLPNAGKEAKPKRMIHHDGYIRLRTPRPYELVEKSTKVVEAAGGYVERLDGSSGVFRVPVAVFQKVFAQILGLGEVLDQSIFTEDISDAFMDVDLRLKIARSTLERLTELLSRAKDEKEKVRILREIQRIRTEVETLAAQKELLLTKARFSTITLDVEGRSLKKAGIMENIEAFLWIQDLSPFNDKVVHKGRHLEFKVPEGMVALKGKDLWVAESADGAFMRASQHHLQPEGDTDFWLQAVRRRLGPDYGDVKVMEQGDFKLLRLEDRSETPYIYLIGLHADKSHTLQIVEIYYPASAQEKRYQKQVFECVTGGAI